MSVDPVEILHETDRILDRKGWSSHGPRGEDGEVCLGVALDEVFGDLVESSQCADMSWTLRQALESEVAAYIGPGRNPHFYNVPGFNDYFAESLEDIKRVTKGARVRLGGQG